ncbi:TetR family transcriptional regulator [Frankia sp. AgKG'84/4]|uniref:TetR family transcriptional regulator n=1 Tax=Frankia sp. AgKG'84/4 TaxID=573490 RepID=UPI00200C7FF2|nr:TetR family transcriptional regulator [Frankia sp. AgKG'84/4]MCL9793217.1 TetR family transcriptional regulator [Frankia sp. AgKG'84/4]
MAKLESLPLPVDGMTPRQRERRRVLTEAVIALVEEIGPEKLQMRDVADRSGVALGTMYRYFASKDHLLAAAWADWHGRLAGRVQAEFVRGHDSPVEVVLSLLRRELRSFRRHPNVARLIVMVQSSAEPFASEAIAEVTRAQDGVFAALLEEVPAQVAAPARMAINAMLSSGLREWVTGRRALDDVQADLEAVVRHVLGPCLLPSSLLAVPAARMESDLPAVGEHP